MGITDIDPTVLQVLSSISGSIDWLTAELSKARLSIIRNLAKLLSNPLAAFFGLIWAIIVSITLGILFEELKKVQWIKDIIDFITNLGKLITGILNFMQVDTLIALVRLGAVFNDQWRAALAMIYKSLGALSEELGRGWSFISSFAEINRTLLYSAYSLTGNAWIESQAAYASGLTKWLGGVEGKLDVYISDPDAIFRDLQQTIAEAHVSKVDESAARIFAGIDYASDWIKTRGEIVIKTVGDIDSVVKGMPQEIQDSIASYYVPFRRDFESFVEGQWKPFFQKYDAASRIILDSFDAMNIDVEAIEERIKSPADFLALIMGQDPEERRKSLLTLKDIFDESRRETIGEGRAILQGTLESAGFMDVTPPIERAAPPEILPSGRNDFSPPSLPPPAMGSWQKGEY
jgi:hypothetical protein